MLLYFINFRCFLMLMLPFFSLNNGLPLDVFFNSHVFNHIMYENNLLFFYKNSFFINEKGVLLQS
jgi:hypothetical protein